MIPSSKIYFDYAATTPVDPVVLRAMEPYFSERFGNAGSLHSFGQVAISALDAARKTIAASIGASFQEVVFTGSATEANNLVLRGIIGKPPITRGRLIKPRIIISSIEHESILETARSLENNGIDVVHLPINQMGIVDLKKLETSLNKNTILVSVMYANNEIGTIQPISKIARVIHNFKNKNLGNPFFHTDASQAFQFFDCDVSALGVDFMTLSSHKIYGPKGAGALYMKQNKKKSTMNDPPLIPQITGGGQEFGIRAGTENIPAIVGFAKAVELLAGPREIENKRISGLCGELWRGIKKIYPKAQINGICFSKTSSVHDPSRLPNILNIYFPKKRAQDLLTKFDLLGLAASSGSACHARASVSSYVIEALGYSKERARSSVRFSLGRPTTKKEVVHGIHIIEKTIHSIK